MHASASEDDDRSNQASASFYLMENSGKVATGAIDLAAALKLLPWGEILTTWRCPVLRLRKKVR